jgi:hypothetical protein
MANNRHHLTSLALSTKIQASLKQVKYIDYVLVYNSSKIDEELQHEKSYERNKITNKKNKARAEYRKYFLDNLKLYGLKIRKVIENDGAVYILVHTPFEKLLEIAEKSKLKLPIEENEIGRFANGHFMSSFWHKFSDLPTEINEEKETKYFTAPYTSNLHAKFARFFDKDNIEETFLFKDRCLLTYELLCRTCFSKPIKNPSEIFECINKDDEKSIGIERLLVNGTFQAAFPLHEEYDTKIKRSSNDDAKHDTKRQLLWDYWASPRKIFAFRQPFNLITEYFGEKVGFYFAWLILEKSFKILNFL